MESSIQQLQSKFSAIFGSQATRFACVSPGRVNLIGEHTDYNEGFVLPGAIDKALVFVIGPAKNAIARFYAADKEQSFECDLKTLRRVDLQWANYLIGILDQFRNANHKFGGFNVVFGGNVPVASGLSSSAALGAGFAFALNEVFQFGIDRLALAQLAQKSETEFVGVRCGIMDQFANLFGREGRVVRLDCRSLEYEYIPFDRKDIRVVLCDTQVKRELASSEYNQRRSQCHTGVTLLKKRDRTIRSLRDVPRHLLKQYERDLDPVTFRRCLYVIEENERVVEACDDLKKGDLSAFGKRMFESHAGLRDLYEVSIPELDILVNLASELEGVFGARLMGAGFGGCTINIVQDLFLDEFTTRIQERYESRTGKPCRIYVTQIRAGTRLVAE